MKLKSVLLVALFLIPVGSAFAGGNSQGGTIIHVASVGETLLFQIAGNTETNRPACATTKRFSAHKDSIHVAVILTAFSTGKKLASVGGLGTCNLWSNSEDLDWMEVCPANTGCQ